MHVERSNVLNWNLLRNPYNWALIWVILGFGAVGLCIFGECPSLGSDET